jgi:phosphate transport system protein
MNTVARTAFDLELAHIRDDVLRLGSLVEMQVARAMRALIERNAGEARRVIADDVRADTLRRGIEQRGLELLATQQPAARDLRSIVATMHIAVELERMADHAMRIARASLALDEQRIAAYESILGQMQQSVCQITRGALDAYLRQDVALARVVSERDENVDQLCRLMLKQSLTLTNPDRAMQLFWVAQALERIGDRATNICERVVFVATGDLADR